MSTARQRDAVRAAKEALEVTLLWPTPDNWATYEQANRELQRVLINDALNRRD